MRFIGGTFFLMILILALFPGNRSFAGTVSDCDQVAVGSLTLTEDAELSSDSRFVLKYNKTAMLKGDGLNLTITALETSRTVQFSTKSQAVFLAPSNDLEKVLLQSSVGDRSEFFLHKINGDRILQFKIFKLNQLDEDINHVQYDQGHQQWLIATNRRLLAFLEGPKIVKTLFELDTSDTPALEWFNYFNKTEPLLTANQNKSLMILTAKIVNGIPTSVLRVFDATTFQLAKTVEIPTQTSPLKVDDTHLLFEDQNGKSFYVVDIRTGELKNIFLQGGPQRSSLMKEIFKGPGETFGLIDEQGGVRYFTFTGKIKFKTQVPQYQRWTKIKLMEGSQKLVLLDSDQISTFIFDIQTGEFIRLPEVMNSMASSGHTPYRGQEILLPIFNKQTGRLSLLEYEIHSHCLQDLPALKSPGEFYDLFSKNQMTALSWLDHQSNTNLAGINSRTWSSMNTKDQNLWKAMAKEFLKNYLIIEQASSMQNTFHRISRWLTVFQSVLLSLKDDDKDILIDNLAIGLSEKTIKTSQYQDFPISKVANIYIANLNPYFGKPPEPRADMILLMDHAGSLIRPVAIASAPMETFSNEASAGFYVKMDFPFLNLQPHQAFDFNFKWQVDSQLWTANGRAEILPLKNLINKESAPNYQQLWADGQLTGLVLVSPNLGEPSWLIRQYLKYFTDQGFSFGPEKIVFPPREEFWKRLFTNTYLMPSSIQTVSNLKSWIMGLVQDGQLDYWIKEAHGGGHDEVAFVAPVNSILKGIKNLKDGRQEVIFIAYPSSVSSDNKMPMLSISNSEFGSWIRNRQERHSKSPLVYINASCWSAPKAQQEIIATRSPLLIEIATNMPALTFNNAPMNHTQVLLSSFRQGLSYDKIRAKLEAVKTADGTKNPFIMPNQSEYDKKIWSGLESALNYTVKVSSE